MQIAELLPASFDSDPVLDFDAELEEAARAVDAEPWVVQRLKHPEREITLNLPLVRDDGSVVNVTAYRVQHSHANGPSIGPVLLSPTAHVAKLRTVAAEITLQSALLGLRLGGAAGAIVIDPEQYSERELRKLVREYIFALRDNIGPLSDVLVPRGNERIRQWMHDAYTRAKGVSEPAAVVGSEELYEAIAGATAGLIQHALGSAGALARVALQGFGTRGRTLARALRDRGGKIIAVADRSGGAFQEDGIDINALAQHVADHGVIFGFPAATAVSNADVLECKCDALVLAAGERQIGSFNGAKIRAGAVIELTSGAVTSDGAESLPPSCLYIPHLIAGASELAVWDYEWRKGLTYSAIDVAEAERETSARVNRAHHCVRQLADKRETGFRGTTNALAVALLRTELRAR